MPAASALPRCAASTKHFAVSRRGGKNDRHTDADAVVHMLDWSWLNCTESLLVKFDVKKECIPDLKHDLRLAGISEETIFPDLEGLGRELWFWFDPPGRPHGHFGSNIRLLSRTSGLLRYK
jgi:hypothetical protein